MENHRGGDKIPMSMRIRVKDNDPIVAPTLVDVFSGAGGMSLGFALAGFIPVLAIDKVKDCTDTYAHNHPIAKVLNVDVKILSDRRIKSILREHCNLETVDVVVGGPPCESFSTAGPAIRKPGDTRDTLYEHVIRIAHVLDAKYIVIENIPGLISKGEKKGPLGSVFLGLLHTLLDYGYCRYDFKILNAADYGVPQYRERLFIMATKSRDLPLAFPNPTHGLVVNSNGKRPRISVSDALSDLPFVNSRIRDSEKADYYASDPKNNYQLFMRGRDNAEFSTSYIHERYMKELCTNGKKLTYQWAPNHRPPTIERMKMIKQGEGLRDLWMRLEPNLREELKQKRVVPNKWYIQRFRRLVSDLPAVTVTSHCLDEMINPWQDRLITVREAARLQSFPDWYQFVGGKWINPHGYEPQDKYEQVGDAVPPLLASAIAHSIIRGLSCQRENMNGRIKA
jgi:DNA (cytosine-5)-methyltransferase 1